MNRSEPSPLSFPRPPRTCKPLLFPFSDRPIHAEQKQNLWEQKLSRPAKFGSGRIFPRSILSFLPLFLSDLSIICTKKKREEEFRFDPGRRAAFWIYMQIITNSSIHPYLIYLSVFRGRETNWNECGLIFEARRAQ
jgi:hypothetical protein